MADSLDRGSKPPAESPAGSPGTAPRGVAEPSSEPPARPAATITTTTAPRSEPPVRSASPWRKRILLAAVVVGLIAGGIALIPEIRTAFNTVSTDDAYINGHVTFLAARVGGQVSRVFVDDNMQVRRGDILVQLDREPYEVQRAIQQAAVTAAEAGLTAAQALVRGEVAQIRANRFQLARAIEEVNTKIAELRSNVSALNSQKATLDLARANLKRGEQLLPGGGISKEDVDMRRQAVKVDEANVDQALQAIYATRVGLGLPARPPEGNDLSQTPPELAEDFSAVRRALGILLQSAAQLGYSPSSWNVTPKQAIEEFYKLDPEGNLERIYARLIPQAPAIKQAEAKLLQARRDLAKAELDLRYCDVVSDIDGVVTRRNVNPGNNVQAGQNLMAIRSQSEIWVDANFKETQLADLRIGQRVLCKVDMYGRHREFEGRITGFTMGTGQTLSLLPPRTRPVTM
ncbi:membrane fusion protein, multidrug efflux system [Singulisphaera sp. GP187]|uniref:efflux RND transporter periplasmic adaptor subunit n=1 Tax=Singulisphaera sp. GP187 TaxID=1882752 RepID=UPI00092851A7|nr:efflux RND transporter periplasmic adaptor subunit [Singulisphaera sp. GP187]SIN73991.1 membrane fusion protein, multidrug efflux system [Singulisphaera sp. GP187]